MIPHSRPVHLPKALEYVDHVLATGRLAQGPYTKRCEGWLEDHMQSGKAFLVTSGTTALEMAAMIIDIRPGDEVILPSYTFVSTVNAFVARGATPVFVDIERDTMNMDVSLVEAAITPKTRAIVPVHYAGISCDMAPLMEIAARHDIMVVEDAAQSLDSKYRGVFSGTIGHIGCISFHETKNFTSGGQGGAVLVNRDELVERAEIVYDNGTNRVQFLRGELPAYEWQDVGSNHIMSEVLAAILWSQLEMSHAIQRTRLRIWNRYQTSLQQLSDASGEFDVLKVPEGCEPNGHIFYIKLRDPARRPKFVQFMKERGVTTSSHYSPLHASPIGRRIGRFVGVDENTSPASVRLVRLPIYFAMSEDDQSKVISLVHDFFGRPESRL
ncbi:dTDP-4-amino-4,6-dideoxygalactose transaminase [Colletotrichum sidae]|uniref:dTDP-4-amino-4,6-dideoxygalactose transaminase n=2 Tax=Colletotrichum orbiculare species complex TaxID=2707354 RepID=A0A4R8PS70_9PEZI|nr:dTDP-4-amino-4,6-dideoxygalactose transaminase [Colletotrichum spinosum]TEA19723.1 dTDP-4-amino-4,6-dideoxygalactose transaminase [Colletotrichum sidae]